jgi:hypothetical protein
MRDRLLFAGVALSLLLSIVAVVLSTTDRRFAATDLLTRFGIPDDADIVMIRAKLDTVQITDNLKQIDEFIVEPRHVPRIMAHFRPMAALDESDVGLGNRVGSLTIETRNTGATLKLDFYDWGQNPVVFTADHVNWFVGNPWHRGFGEIALEWALLAAYADIVTVDEELGN